MSDQAPTTMDELRRAVQVRRDLDRRMRKVLAELELIASGATSTVYDRDRVAVEGADHDGTPSGDRDPRYLYYMRRYDGCRTDEQRGAVIHDAAEELRNLRVQKPAPGTHRRLDTDIARDPRHVSIVALENGVSVATVYRLRAKHSRRAA